MPAGKTIARMAPSGEGWTFGRMVRQLPSGSGVVSN